MPTMSDTRRKKIQAKQRKAENTRKREAKIAKRERNAKAGAARVTPMRRRSVAPFALMLAGLAGCSGLSSQGGAAPLPAMSRLPPPMRRCARRRSSPAGPRASSSSPASERAASRSRRRKITITAPPAKGDVSFVPGQETTIQYSAQGTCIGQKAQGTGIYYTARAGQQGTDRFSVAAKLASGEAATRTFEVRIAE